MHLIVLSRFPDSQAYGAETSLFYVCQELARRGHWITLLYNQVGDLLPEYRNFCFHTQQVKNLSVYGRKKMILSTPSLIADALKLPRVPYDLVYANQFPYIWAGTVLSRMKKIPLVCHHRDGVPTTAMSSIWPFLFRQVAMNIFVSEDTRASWVKQGLVAPRRAVTVHNGIPEEFFTQVPNIAQVRRDIGIGEDQKVILYVGRLVPQKGVETLLDAFSKMHRQDPRAHLWLAGDAEVPAYREALEARCDVLGISPSVHFVGFQKNVVPFYQASDEVVLPSAGYESFGKTVVESMACGTPALGSRIGGIPEILSGPFQRFLFSPGDSKELFHRMRESLDWRYDEPSLSSKCREHVRENFSIEKTVDGIEQAFARTVRL